MEKSPFVKRAVDSVSSQRRNMPVLKTQKTKTNNTLFAKILGVILSCILAFVFYNFYSNYKTIEEKPVEENNITSRENGIVIELPQKFIGVDVSNGRVGSKIQIKSSKISPYTEVNFEIIKPDGSLYQFTGQSKIDGFVKMDLKEDILTQVGEHKINIKAKGYETKGVQSFYLRVGEIAPNKSRIISEVEEIYIDGEPAKINVVLNDKYENPILDTKVKLISTRPQFDLIESFEDGITNESGIASFLVSSNEAGVSSYLAIVEAKNSLSELTIEEKIEINFKSPDVSFGTYLLNYLLPNALASDVAYFVVESETTFHTGEASEVLVKAYNNSSVVDTTFSGTITFVTGDPLASIPADYEFTEEDLGSHVFELTFNTPGSYKITTHAMGDASVKGEKTVIVKDKEAGAGSFDRPVILYPPKDGQGRIPVISDSNITIAGNALSDMTIEIIDNETKLGETVSRDGKFFYNTMDLVDGRHSVKAIAINNEGKIVASEVVEFIIDTVNPIIKSVLINPIQVEPGQIVTITLETEPGLTTAKAIVDRMAISLAENISKAGTYVGTYTASDQEGEYMVDIELQDSVANTVPYYDQGVILISKEPVLILPEPELEPEIGLPPVIIDIPAPRPIVDPPAPPETGPELVYAVLFLLAVSSSFFLFRTKV